MRARHSVFIALMVIVGLNLRPAMSSVAPLLNRLQEVAGLSAAAAGVLTTLPVLFLGLAAPLAPLLAQRIGSERALSTALCLLLAGLILRGLPLPGVFVPWLCPSRRRHRSCRHTAAGAGQTPTPP